jgi:hypothetical protein
MENGRQYKRYNLEGQYRKELFYRSSTENSELRLIIPASLRKRTSIHFSLPSDRRAPCNTKDVQDYHSTILLARIIHGRMSNC